MKRALRPALVVCLICGALIVTVTIVFDGGEDGAPAHGFDLTEYAPIQVIEPLPPVVRLPLKRSSEVKDEVEDEELVLGVEIGGESRAYPVNQMIGPRRDVLNDNLGGTAIAATW